MFQLGTGDVNEIDKCTVCKKTNAKKCSGCKLLAYCSIEHQRQDWSNHKSFCKLVQKAKMNILSSHDLFDVISDSREIVGKLCVASKPIAKGALILEEEPLFIHYPTSMVTVMINQCVTCGLGIEKDKSENSKPSRCSKCNWPVCNQQCEKAPLHADNECLIFVANNILYPEDPKDRDKNFGDLIMTYRGLGIRCQNLELWNRILDIFPLVSLDEFDKKKEILQDIKNNGKSISKMDISNFPQLDLETNVVPREEILAQLTVISRRVGFPVTMDDKVGMKTFRMFLFKNASKFGNSCSPNCYYSIGPSPTCRIQIRSAVSIARGEILTVNRQGHMDMHLGTESRQKMMLERFKRYCKCRLCKDPEEFDTFQSGIICRKCRRIKAIGGKLGYFVPSHLTAEVPGQKPFMFTQFKCNKCGEIKADELVSFELHEIWKEVRAILEAKFDGESQSNWKLNKINELENFVEKHKKKILHPNHWIIQKALDECQTYLDDFPNGPEPKHGVETGKEFLKIDLQVYERAIQRLTYLIRIMEKTLPGIHPHKARSLGTLGAALLTYYKKLCYRDKDQDRSNEEWQKIYGKLMTAKDYMNEALLYWDTVEPPVKQKKHHMAEHLTDKLEEVQRVIQVIQQHCNELQTHIDKLAQEKEEGITIFCKISSRAVNPC